MLVRDPLHPVLLLQLPAQDLVDLAQIDHVAARIGQLLLGQRPAHPVGELRGFIDRPLHHAPDQVLVRNGIAQPARHRRDLCVEHRTRHMPDQARENLKILPRRVKYLRSRRVRDQLVQRRKIDALG